MKIKELVEGFAILTIPFASTRGIVGDSLSLSDLLFIMGMVVCLVRGIKMKVMIFAFLISFYLMASPLLFLLLNEVSSVYSLYSERVLSVGLMSLKVFSIIIVFYSIENIENAKKFLMIGLVLSLGLGYVQLFVYLLSGIDIFPINLIEVYFFGGERVTGKYLLGGDYIFRVSGISGEPKNFGVMCVFLILIINLLFDENKFLAKRAKISLKLFSVVGVFLSASTTSIIFLFAYLIFGYLINNFRILGSRRFVTIVISAFVPLIFVVYFNSDGFFISQYDNDLALESTGVSGYIETRLLSRIGLEDFDWLSSQVIAIKSYEMLLGGAYFFLSQVAPDEIFANVWVPSGTYFSPKTGFLSLMVIFGPFVFSIVVLLYAKYISAIWIRVVNKKYLYFCGMFVPILFLLRFEMLAYMIFMLSLLRLNGVVR